MRLTSLSLAAFLLAGSALAGFAAAKEGDAFKTIDLTPIGGDIYYLACEDASKDVMKCGVLSLWVEDNPVPGLQMGIFNSNDQAYQWDRQLTP